MRLLILLSGILVCGTGAFCFAFYTSTFADVAFLIGVTMFIVGICNTVAYLVSGRGEKRLTETTLVEGLVTALYGFSVLSNQVTDSMITMFFGTWLTVCAVTRFSQSLYVSRFNPRDWIKILPLSIVGGMLGIVMMIPWILESVMPLMLVGGAFLVDGLSMIVYAMYMKDTDKEMAEGEARAKARAEAKRAQHKADREEKERLRNLSQSEREKEEAERRRKDKEAEIARQQQRAERRAARRAAARPAAEVTIRLESKEVEAINAAAEDGDAVKAPSVPASAEAHAAVKIPRLRAARDNQEKKQESRIEEARITAVNLAELEEKSPEVEFEKVELPEVRFVSDDEKADREKIMESLDNWQVKKEENVEYEKIDLEELVKEPMARPADPADAVRFTQTLDFSWVNKLNEELDKK